MRMTLKAWRKAKDFSTRAIAKELGITQTTYINWEKNPKKISIENAFRISTILDVEVNDIIFFPENSKKI